MSSDIEDPNNHVPEISPYDDWDDLDAASEKSKMGLPPRRPDRGLPPKKVAKGPIVNLHEPKLRVEQELQSGDDIPSEEVGEEVETVSKEKKSRRKAPAKKAAKKAAKKTAKPKKNAVTKTAKGKKTASKSESSETDEISEPDADDTKEGSESVLPLLQPARTKRLNHQIGTGDAKVNSGPSQQLPATASGKITAGNEEDVARMRRRFVRGERVDWGEVKGNASNQWIAYTGLGVVLLVILAVFLGQLSGKKSERRTERSFYSQLEPTEAKKKDEGDDLEMLEMLTSSQEKAKVMYAAYLSASSASEIAGLLYNKDVVMPLFEKSWKPGNVPKGWTPGEDTLWTVLDRDGERYGILEGMNSDFTRFTVFFRKEGEDLKIDWKATTGFGSSTFEEMKTGKGDGSEIRAWISRSDFYTFSLPEEKYRSFRLMSPDGDSTLWVYTQIGSELDEKLLKLFVPSQITGEVQNEIQVQLRMEPGPDDGLRNQWMIRDLLRLSWLDGVKE